MFNNKKIPNISQLHATRNQKEQARNEIFTIVLNKCIEQILDTNNKRNQTYLYFEVPNIIIGFQEYDRLACIHYLIHELSRENYKVEFVEPFYLYIDWSANLIKPKSIDNIIMQNVIPTSNPERLKQQTKELLKKYPHASKIVFEYQDSKTPNASLKNKKNKI